MTPPTTAPGPQPQPQPPRQASALLEVAIAAAPMLAAATRAVKSFRIVSTSIHDGFCRGRREAARLQCGGHAQPRAFVDAIGCSMAVWLSVFALKTVTCGFGYFFFISFAAFSAASYVPNPDFSCRSTAT